MLLINYFLYFYLFHSVLRHDQKIFNTMQFCLQNHISANIRRLYTLVYSLLKFCFNLFNWLNRF